MLKGGIYQALQMKSYWNQIIEELQNIYKLRFVVSV